MARKCGPTRPRADGRTATAMAGAMAARLGYGRFCLYALGEFPGVMDLEVNHGFPETMPPSLAVAPGETPEEALSRHAGNIPGLMTASLRARRRTVGVAAAVPEKGAGAADAGAFGQFAALLSETAYAEKIAIPSYRQERVERDVYLAHVLHSKLCPERAPGSGALRVGLATSIGIDVGDEFYDFLLRPNGTLRFFMGRHRGGGLEGMMEAVYLSRIIRQALGERESLREAGLRINDHLIADRKPLLLRTLFLADIDPKRETINTLAAGVVAAMLIHSDHNHFFIQKTGFIGMIAGLELFEEQFEFSPGSALSAASESAILLNDPEGNPISPEIQLELATRLHKDGRPAPLAEKIFAEAAERFDIVRNGKNAFVISVENVGRGRRRRTGRRAGDGA